MNVKCFSCGALIEAESLPAAEEAFLAHGAANHEWNYGEAPLRTYVRNYAEAVDRSTGATKRLASVGEVAIRPVTPENVDDWVRFFDHDAFSDNPDWASCYCLEPHVPTTPENPERPWRESRSSMIRRLNDGLTYGYLAYVNKTAAGWLNASFRKEYGLFRTLDPDGPEPGTVIGLACFVIAPPYRRHGVASRLLDHALAAAPSRGALWVEAYPRNTPEGSDAGHFRGPASMYQARGFRSAIVRERDTIMRLRCAGQ